jgi:hypothetical protein
MERETRPNQVFLRSRHNWREIDGCCMCCRSPIFLRELLNLELLGGKQNEPPKGFEGSVNDSAFLGRKEKTSPCDKASVVFALI